MFERNLYSNFHSESSNFEKKLLFGKVWRSSRFLSVFISPWVFLEFDDKKLLEKRSCFKILQINYFVVTIFAFCFQDIFKEKENVRESIFLHCPIWLRQICHVTNWSELKYFFRVFIRKSIRLAFHAMRLKIFCECFWGEKHVFKGARDFFRSGTFFTQIIWS